MNGWIILDKPGDITSRKAGGIVARMFGAKTFGHLGTLDPMASGLLPIALGDATKMIPYLDGECKKEYLFSVVWGVATDTLDITGTIINTSSVIPTISSVRVACSNLIGDIMQTPPQYSAVSVGGIRAYKFARGGKHVDIPPRKIKIYELELLNNHGSSTIGHCFRVVCSPGTYVRVLSGQIAEKCGAICAVDMIRRVKTNGFDIKDAVSLDFPEKVYNNLKPVDYGLDDIPVCNLNQADAQLFQRGGFIESKEQRAKSRDGLRRVYCESVFLGIGCIESGVLKPKRVLN